MVEVLRRTITEAQVAHALLFFGPEGIGKRMTALAYAKALNCLDDEARRRGDFCDACRACRLINVHQHPDVRLFTPETTGGKTVIPIDAIRTKVGESSPHPLPLREDAALKPLEGRCKVYILDPANRPGLQEDAGNALLLTLEEPPPYVVIILISSRPTAVLPTLVSRCRPVRFQLAPQSVVLQALHTQTNLPPAETAALSGMAAGRIGWALNVATRPQMLEARRALFATLETLLPAGRPAALRLADTLHRLTLSVVATADEAEGDAARTTADRAVRAQLPEMLDLVASWWRDLLLTEMGHPAQRLNVDWVSTLDAQRGLRSVPRLEQGVQTILKTKRLIERNANIDLALEAMWMALLA